MVAERRRSLSPSVFPEEEYEKFARADARVTNENKASTVFSMLQGIDRLDRCIDGPGIRLANLENLFVDPPDYKTQPDIWYGARPQQIDPRIRDNKGLGTWIVPTTTDFRPCAPNLFVEVEGPGGAEMVCLVQATFDGAIGTRGMHKLQTYSQQVQTYDHKAYTISATYSAGTLKMYAHHLRQPNGPGTEEEYYMHLIGAWALIGDRETHLKGMTAFRNAEDWTKAQRDAAILHANAVVNSVNTNGEDDDNR